MPWWILFACGAAPEPVPPEPAPPEPEAAAPAAPLPATADTPAEPSCSADETTRFTCGVGGDKVVSLCETATGLQYRFGRPGALELAAPDPASNDAFAFSHEAWVRAEADAVRLVNDDVEYWIVDKSGSGALGEGEMNNFTGVVVREAGKELARLPCTWEPHSRLADLAESLTQVGYME